MKMKWVSLLTLVLLMSLNQAVMADGYKDDFIAGECYQKITEKLDLTADQKAKVKLISSQGEEYLKAKALEMHAIQEQINQQADSTAMDENKVDALVGQKREIMGSMIKMRAVARHAIYNLLTDKQRAQLANMKSTSTAKIDATLVKPQ